jgi:murein DD-endopeptidase MepM/ murein hydrolase activator NlpD
MRLCRRQACVPGPRRRGAKRPPARLLLAALACRPLFAILLTALAPALLAAPAALIPLALYPAEGARGEALSGAALSEEALAWLVAEMRNPAGATVSTGRGFALDPGGQVWSFLLALPSTLPGGDYSLRLEGGGPQVRFAHTGPVRVAATLFSSEKIHFDRNLSRLMTVPDPQKEEELRRLRAELEAFRPEAVHHTGALLNPVAGARQTAAFADRREYLYTDGGSSLSLHNGVDLAAPTGTPVLASGSGRVVLAGERLLSGKTVVLEHLPGVFSLYFHLSELAVTEGQEVQAGQRIGAVGMSGLATGPHLHWELRVNGWPVDPRVYLTRPLVDKSRYYSILEELYRDERR